MPGHGLEAVTVPKGVRSGEVIDIETTDAPKQQQKEAKASSPRALPERLSVSMPPPKAPPPLNTFQREQVRAALGHETYQEVVNEALKVDQEAEEHQQAKAGAGSDHDTITITSPAESVKASAAAGASEGRIESKNLPRSLQKAAMSVHKIQTQQQALESSVKVLEAAASKFMTAHTRKPVQAQARQVQLADVGAIRAMNAMEPRSQAREASVGGNSRVPRKLLSKAVATRAARRGDSAAELAQRVEDMGATWNQILHPDPDGALLSEHPSWQLPQLEARMPSIQKIEVPGTQLQWKPYTTPGVPVQPAGGAL